jgi:hypothetical protein
MEKIYKNIHLLFIGVFLILIWGFYKSYIIFFPTFDGGLFGGSSYNYIQHTHGALMLTWVLFLIIQPILIKRRLYNIHRTIGKVSYVIVPMLLFSIFLVTKTFYYRTLTLATAKDAIGTITGIVYIIAFAIFYFLAIANRKNIPSHMRYMIGTSLLLINPGLSRALSIFFGLAESGLAISDYVAMSIPICFIAYDYRNNKNYKPYIVILVFLIIIHLIWVFRNTNVWQTIGQNIVLYLF